MSLNLKSLSTFAAVIFGLTAFPVLAAPGQFDTSFGHGGIAVVATTGEAKANHLTTDAVGRAMVTGQERFANPLSGVTKDAELIVRLQSSGSLYIPGQAGHDSESGWQHATVRDTDDSRPRRPNGVEAGDGADLRSGFL